MPYMSPYRAPLRRAHAGRPQLGFAPLVLAASAVTKISAFDAAIKKISGLFGGLFQGKDPERIRRAKEALASAMAGDGKLFDGVDARTWINQQRFSSASDVGRKAYQAAWDQLMTWEQEQAAAGIPTPSSAPGDSTWFPSASGGEGMSSYALPLLGAGALALFFLAKSKRRS